MRKIKLPISVKYFNEANRLGLRDMDAYIEFLIRVNKELASELQKYYDKDVKKILEASK